MVEIKPDYDKCPGDMPRSHTYGILKQGRYTHRIFRQCSRCGLVLWDGVRSIPLRTPRHAY